MPARVDSANSKGAWVCPLLERVEAGHFSYVEWPKNALHSLACIVDVYSVVHDRVVFLRSLSQSLILCNECIIIDCAVTTQRCVGWRHPAEYGLVDLLPVDREHLCCSVGQEFCRAGVTCAVLCDGRKADILGEDFSCRVWQIDGLPRRSGCHGQQGAGQSWFTA